MLAIVIYGGILLLGLAGILGSTPDSTREYYRKKIADDWEEFKRDNRSNN